MKQVSIQLLSLFFVFAGSVHGQANDYLGQALPLDTPVIFARGIVSDRYGNRDMAISPDGNEMFYTFQFNGLQVNVIMYIERSQGKWLAPRVASFSGVYGDLEPAFSPDGTRLYFSSNRPVTDTGKARDNFNIWYVTKQNLQWGTPVHLDAPINSNKNEFYASVAKSGNIYFTGEPEHGKGQEDIMVCYYKNGMYSPAESLSDSVNTAYSEFNAFVDPAERYIIFSSYGRKDNGGGDLYISWKNKSGQWGTAKNLPVPLNSAGIDYCPYVSPDGKYFFFTSSRTRISQPFSNKITMDAIHTALDNAGNGLDDIYWVRFEALLHTK